MAIVAEFRTPLTGIQAQRVMRDEDDSGRDEGVRHRNQQDARRLNRLVNGARSQPLEPVASSEHHV